MNVSKKNPGDAVATSTNKNNNINAYNYSKKKSAMGKAFEIDFEYMASCSNREAIIEYLNANGLTRSAFGKFAEIFIPEIFNLDLDDFVNPFASNTISKDDKKEEEDEETNPHSNENVEKSSEHKETH